MNSTSWDEARDEMIVGGQLHRYFQPVWHALAETGVPYTVGRQPAMGAVNAYPNTRPTYVHGSYRRDRVSGGGSHELADQGYREVCRFLQQVVLTGAALAEVLLRDGFPLRKLHVAGYPKLDPLFRGEVDGAGFWSGDGRIKVLYAPTHGGGSERWRNGNPDAPGARATSWWHRDQVAGLL